MPELDSALEVTKLAAELEVEQADLDYLAVLPAPALRGLRETFVGARFARHEARFKRIAALSSRLPAPLAAKVAEAAFGPHLCARIASVMKPEDAVGLARRLDARFLAQISRYLDTSRSADIIGRIEDNLLVKIGQLLLADKEHLVLGRFVSVVSTDNALKVVEGATPDDLLQIALLTEDSTALNAIIERLDDPRLAAVVRAGGPAKTTGPLATLIRALSATNAARVESLRD